MLLNLGRHSSDDRQRKNSFRRGKNFGQTSRTFDRQSKHENPDQQFVKLNILQKSIKDLKSFGNFICLHFYSTTNFYRQIVTFEHNSDQLFVKSKYFVEIRVLLKKKFSFEIPIQILCIFMTYNPYTNPLFKMD